MTLTTDISRTLLEVTGEPRAEIAIYGLLKDAIEHRIEKIDAGLKKLEDKYHMPFSEFSDRFHKNEIPNAYGYEIESDFLDWEGLNSRMAKYQSLLPAFPDDRL